MDSRGAAGQNDAFVCGHVEGTFRYPSREGTYKYGPRCPERGGSGTYMILDEMAKEKITEKKEPGDKR